MGVEGAGGASGATGYSLSRNSRFFVLLGGGEEVRMEETKVPAFRYYLDESDPDILILQRQDDCFVAAFSASGATKESILETAQEDYRALVREYLRSRGAADPGPVAEVLLEEISTSRGIRVTDTPG